LTEWHREPAPGLTRARIAARPMKMDGEDTMGQTSPDSASTAGGSSRLISGWDRGLDLRVARAATPWPHDGQHVTEDR
jgi:hypothetical protein